MYGAALRVVRQHDLADDVAQETFLRAWQRLSSFDLQRPFGPWVCRIAVNLAINYVRSPARREEPLSEDRPDPPDRAASPLGRILDQEAEVVLQSALQGLPAEQRAVLTLRVVEEMSYKEIAEALGVPAGTVMSRLARARERLVAALGPYLGSSGARVEEA